MTISGVNWERIRLELGKGRAEPSGGRGLSSGEILTANLEDYSVSVGPFDRELAAIGDIAHTVKLTKNIINSTHEIFSGRKKWTGEALSVVAGLRIDFARIDQLFPNNNFNPYFKLFKDQVSVLVPSLMDEYKLFYPLGNEWDDSVSKLNGFVNAVRLASKEEGFIRSTQSYIRNSNKNQVSLNNFIGRMFSFRSRLLVIRVDLEYGREYALGSESPIGYEETDRHRKMLLSDLRRRLCKDCYVGYVWKLEYGLMNSFHYHFLIFLDAAKVRRDVKIAKVIGEHWKNKITEGKGRYWNCNAKKNDYRYRGIGEIPYNNYVLRENLLKTASYLIKSDYYIRSAIPANRRTFGKGAALPKVKTNRGRPRHV